MNKFDNCIKAYYINPAWMLETWECEAIITFGFFDIENGGTAGEIDMRWYMLDGKSTPRLECWHDAFAALHLMKHVIYLIGRLDDTHLTVEEFIEILNVNGFKNITK